MIVVLRIMVALPALLLLHRRAERIDTMGGTTTGAEADNTAMIADTMITMLMAEVLATMTEATLPAQTTRTTDAEEEEGVIATHPAAAHHLPEALRLALGDAVNLHLLARQSMRLILRNDPSFAASWLRGLRRGISESSLKRIWARILSRM